MRLRNLVPLSRTELIRSGLALVAFACLTSQPLADQTDFCKVKAVVHADGSVSLDRHHFSDHESLRQYLHAYRRSFPSCVMTFDADRGVATGTMERIAAVFREAGFALVGFLTEPRPVK